MGNKEVRYGQLNQIAVNVKVPAAASQAFKNLGGKFVKLDANKRADLADSGDAELFGWADVGEITTDSTAGQDEVLVNISLDAVYRMPADAAVTAALVGETCDLIVDSDGIQQADVGESSKDVIQIVAVDAEDIANQTVQVRLNPRKQFATGVV